MKRVTTLLDGGYTFGNLLRYFFTSLMLTITIQGFAYHQEKSVQSSSDDPVTQAWKLVRQAEYQIKKANNPEQGLELARKAQAIGISFKDEFLESYADLWLSYGFSEIDVYDSALRYASKRISFLNKKILQAKGNTELVLQRKQDLMFSYLVLASVYTGFHEMETISASYQLAVDLAEELKNANIKEYPFYLGYEDLVYYNMANYYFNAKDYVKAGSVLLNVTNDKIDSELGSAARLLKAKIQGKLGHNRKAIEIIEEVLANQENSMLSVIRRIELNNELALNYSKIGEMELALKFVENALDLSYRTTSTSPKMSTYDLLYKLNYEQKNYKDALKYYKALSDVYASSLIAVNKREIGRIEAKFEYQSQLENEKMAFETQVARKRNQNKVLSIGGFALLMVLIVLLWNMKLIKRARKLKELENDMLKAEQKSRMQQLEIVKSRSEQQKLNDQLKRERLNNLLDFKRRQLTTSTMAKETLTAQLQKVYDKLFAAKRASESTNLLEEIEEVMRMIRPSLNGGNDWKDFQKHFESVHPDFFVLLKMREPGLTENELRHCAYVQMKLSNKEVAAMHGISPDSVKMARNRVKKKLQVSGEESLAEFLGRMVSENLAA